MLVRLLHAIITPFLIGFVIGVTGIKKAHVQHQIGLYMSLILYKHPGSEERSDGYASHFYLRNYSLNMLLSIPQRCERIK